MFLKKKKTIYLLDQAKTDLQQDGQIIKKITEKLLKNLLVQK